MNNNKPNSTIKHFGHYVVTHFAPFLFLLAGIPLLTLLGFGLHTIYVQGHLLLFMALIAACTALASAVWWFMRYQARQQLDNLAHSEAWVQPAEDWLAHDQQLWDALNDTIQQQLQQNADWGALREHALSLVAQAAKHYHTLRKHQTLAFSVIELLTMTEEVSRRYRVLLKTHVPAVEHVNLSTLRWLYDHRDKYETGMKVWNVYRMLRVLTPTGLLAEARAQLMDHVFGDVSSNVQFALKRALLQEVAAVAIDLYSGRFKVVDHELAHSSTFTASQAQLAPPPEPLRVGFVGQISAGKSSLINALLGNLVAEVGQLPTTPHTQIYPVTLAETTVMQLVDLPGLDNSPTTNAVILEQLSQCDVVIWVLKANQPARAADVAFKQAWDDWFAQPQQLKRRPPVVLGVLNQVDRLPPIHEPLPADWQHGTTAKAQTLRDALAYNQSLLKLPTIVPLALGQTSPYNLAAVQQWLDENYASGLQVQLNRRRLDAVAKVSVQEQFQRLYRLGKSLFK